MKYNASLKIYSTVIKSLMLQYYKYTLHIMYYLYIAYKNRNILRYNVIIHTIENIVKSAKILKTNLIFLFFFFSLLIHLQGLTAYPILYNTKP